MNGLEATREILKGNPGTEVLILSMHESRTTGARCPERGARGYVLKQDAGTNLIAAIERPRAQAILLSQGV